MFEFDFPPSEVNPATAEKDAGHEADQAKAEQASPSEPRVELLPGVDVSDMTVSEFLAVSRPAPERLPASAFAHLTDPHELGQALYEAQGRYHPYDPGFQALILKTSGTFYGNLVVERLAPMPRASRPKAPPLRRKRQPKGWKPPMTNLIALAAEAEADDESNENA